jgi:N-acetyl-gamma-glutamyl-phosphate reductase
MGTSDARHSVPVTDAPARIRAGIVGVSGYSGIELARLLARHPRFQLTLCTSDKWAGKTLGAKLALPDPAAAIAVVGQEDGRKRFGDVDVLFLCTPHEVSIELAPVALAAGTRVVDLSGGFRLPAADYPTWYGFSHGAPALIGEAVYSMPEASPPGANMAAKLRAARLVSNPGCFPTVSALAVLPLLRAGLIEPGTVIIDAKSGTTGAGRKASEDFSFSEIDGDFRAYRVLRHQHTPEIDRVLGLAGIAGARVVFTTHLLPTRRGILATAYGRLTAAAGADPGAAVNRALADFAEGKPFIKVVAPEEVTLSSAVGTNRVVMGARADASRGIVVICAAIDNLVKGASGQAVQNANLMFGLPETTGLTDLVGHLP